MFRISLMIAILATSAASAQSLDGGEGCTGKVMLMFCPNPFEAKEIIDLKVAFNAIVAKRMNAGEEEQAVFQDPEITRLHSSISNAVKKLRVQ